jgi:ATP-dependent protease ClpP protease subunit
MNAGELEHLWNSGKERWKARHRWAAAPPETFLSLRGDVTAAAARNIIDALDRAPDNPIFLTLYSPGGSVAAGMQLYRALRAHAAPVSAHAERADSAALLVFLAADLRTASRQTSFVIHGAAYPDEFSLARQTAAALRNSASGLEEADREVAMIIGTRTRYRNWQLDRDLAGERVLDGEEAQLFGLVHRLIPALHAG